MNYVSSHININNIKRTPNGVPFLWLPLSDSGGAGAVAKHIYVILYFTCVTPTTSVVAQTTVIATQLLGSSER